MAEGRELAIVLLAHDKASEVLNHVHSKFEGLGNAAKVASIGVAAIAAVGAAVSGSLVEMANHAAEAAMQVRKLSMETGLSAEEASKLRYAGERLNIDTDALSKSLGKFSKGLEATHPILEKYGIAVVKSSDGHILMEQTLANVADKFKAMPDGVEKTAIALNLFGKSGKDMIPLLNKGSEGLKEMGDEAAKLGLVFTKQGVDSAFKFGQAQKDLGDRFEAVKNKIGLAVLPVLTQLIGKAVEIADVVMPKVIAVFGIAQTVFGAVGEIIDVLTGRNKEAGGEMRKLIGDGAEPLMKAFAGIRDIIDAVTGAVSDMVTWLNSSDEAANVVKTTLGFLATVVGTVLRLAVDGAAASFHGIAGFIRGIGPAIDAVMGPIRGLVELVQNAIGLLNQLTGARSAAAANDSQSANLGAALQGFASGTSFVPRDMPAFLHRGEAVIPAAQNRGGGGSGVTINIYADVIDAQAVDRLADKIGGVFTQQRRMQGLA